MTLVIARRFGGVMVYTYKNLERNGRLGNQLWQIAWQIGQAEKNQGEVYINSNWRYKDFFSIPQSFFEKKPTKIIDGGTLYYQELHHWQHCFDKVWNYFQPNWHSIEILESMYGNSDLLDYNVNKTAIHCRRGDYLLYPTKFPIPTDKYYKDSIDIVLQDNPDTLFVVFSDDYEWIRKKFTGPNFIHINGISTPLDVDRRGVPSDQWDLFLMTFCQQHIISNSTFSWWGAYLSESFKVCYPSVWFGPDIDALDSRGIDVRDSWVDAIPKDWNKVIC